MWGWLSKCDFVEATLIFKCLCIILKIIKWQPASYNIKIANTKIKAQSDQSK